MQALVKPSNGGNPLRPYQPHRSKVNFGTFAQAAVLPAVAQLSVNP